MTLPKEASAIDHIIALGKFRARLAALLANPPAEDILGEREHLERLITAYNRVHRKILGKVGEKV